MAEVYLGEKVKALQEELEEIFALGSGRTQDQDLDFLFDQLLEVALRALSPGINDPITAMMCVDRIADNLALLANRDLPSPYRYDDEGVLRVIVPVIAPAALLARLFGPIRSYGKADVMTLVHLLNALQKMAENVDNAYFEKALSVEAERIRAEGESALSAADYKRLAGVLRRNAPSRPELTSQPSFGLSYRLASGEEASSTHFQLLHRFVVTSFGDGKAQHEKNSEQKNARCDRAGHRLQSFRGCRTLLGDAHAITEQGSYERV